MSFLNEYTRLFFASGRRNGMVVLDRFWNVPTDVLVSTYKGLIIWQRRLRDRNQLAAMEDRLLKDIGLSREIRDREVAKPFWRR